MPGTKLTYLICFDDHRTFTGDKSSCKVGIIGVPDNREQFETIGTLAQEIKKIDPGSGILLLVSVDRMDDLKKAVRYNIDAYIPRNTNTILRIHNTVKKLISEHSISVFRKKRNFSLYVLLAFLILCGLLILIAYLKLPQYF
jgi:hypothetical protein